MEYQASDVVAINGFTQQEWGTIIFALEELIAIHELESGYADFYFWNVLRKCLEAREIN